MENNDIIKHLRSVQDLSKQELEGLAKQYSIDISALTAARSIITCQAVIDSIYKKICDNNVEGKERDGLERIIDGQKKHISEYFKKIKGYDLSKFDDILELRINPATKIKEKSVSQIWKSFNNEK
jgi:hypothetical protein